MLPHFKNNPRVVSFSTQEYDDARAVVLVAETDGAFIARIFASGNAHQLGRISANSHDDLMRQVERKFLQPRCKARGRRRHMNDRGQERGMPASRKNWLRSFQELFAAAGQPIDVMETAEPFLL